MSTLLLIAALLMQQPAQVPPTTGTIVGRVTYSDRTPFPASFVVALPLSETAQAAPSRQLYSAVTNFAGEFRIANLPAGRYALRTADSVYYPGVPTLASAAGVIVTAGFTVDVSEFVLPAALNGFRVSGRVVRPAGQTNPSVTVSTFGGSQNLDSPISSDGSFEFLHILAGTLSLTVSPALGTQPLNIAVDRDVSGIEIVMPRLVDVEGTISAEGRTNLTGLFDARSGRPFLTFEAGIPMGAEIQSDGTFKASLPEGDYRILTSRAPAGYYLKSLTIGETDLLKNPLKVAASGNAMRIAVTLGASLGVKVSGKVTGLAGDATSRQITLRGIVVSETFEAAINTDNSFALEKVTPGAYTARVSVTSGISSPPVTVTIPNRDVADLSVAVPQPVTVSGRITVEGDGPPPKFTLLLAHGASADWNSSPNDAALAVFRRNAGASTVQILQVSVNALADGTFKIQLPEGEYRIAISRTGIPSPYVLRSIWHGGANLLTEPLKISEKEPAEIQVGFGTTPSNPWSKVSGRVIGFDPNRGPFRIALEGNSTSAIETGMNPDGTFEFPRVLQNSSYTARLLPENKVASSPRFSVVEKDVDKVEIVVPREREIAGRVAVDGNGPVPTFVLSLAGSSNTVTVLVKPDASGAFRIKLPEDERRVSINTVPFGYLLASMSYGSTKLDRCDIIGMPRCSPPPMKIGDGPSEELQVKFILNPKVPFGKVSGRVTGLSPEAGEVRLVLSDASSFNVFEEPVDANGAFAFQSLPQGVYVPSLTGSVRTSLMSPSLINVVGPPNDGARVEITLPPASVKREAPPPEGPPTGARITEFGAASRTPAIEAAAVATLRTINTAEVTALAVTGGKFASLSELITMGLLPTNFRGTVSGFNFGVIAFESDFVVAAIPDPSSVGRYAYYVTPDGTVRYSTIESLAPPGTVGTPVQR